MFEPDPTEPQKFMRVAKAIELSLCDLPGVVFTINIPVGFRFDGASIPRFVWSLIGSPFEPDFLIAACTHDWFCEKSYEIGDYQARVIGDAVFFRLLVEEGKVSRRRAELMYLGVRLNSHLWYSRQKKIDRKMPEVMQEKSGVTLTSSAAVELHELPLMPPDIGGEA